MTTRHDKDFQETAARYYKSARQSAEFMCLLMSQDAWQRQLKKREEEDGGRLLVAFARHMEQTMKLYAQMQARIQLEETVRELEQKTAELAGPSS